MNKGGPGTPGASVNAIQAGVRLAQGGHEGRSGIGKEGDGAVSCSGRNDLRIA